MQGAAGTGRVVGDGRVEAEEAKEISGLFQFWREREHLFFCYGLTQYKETERPKGLRCQGIKKGRIDEALRDRRGQTF